MSAVQTLMARIRAVTGGPVEWWNTGGGCMVVRVATADGGEVLISDLNDSLSGHDYEHDDNLEGFYAGYYRPGYQMTHEDIREVYRSEERTGLPEPLTDDTDAYATWEAQDASHKTVWLHDEAAKCAAAVLAFLPTVPPEPRARMIDRQVVAVTSRAVAMRDMHGDWITGTETTVVTWDRESGNESWTFLEHDTETEVPTEYVSIGEDGVPVFAEDVEQAAPQADEPDFDTVESVGLDGTCRTGGPWTWADVGRAYAARRTERADQ